MSRPPQALVSLGVLLGGWIGARVVLNAFLPQVPSIWPDHPWREIVSSGAMPQAAAKEVTIALAPPEPSKAGSVPLNPGNRLEPRLQREVSRIRSQSASDRVVRTAAPTIVEPISSAEMPGTPYPTTMGEADHWSLSAWALYRRGGAARGIAPNGQLGGSQAGARLQRRLLLLSPRTKISANLRISSPLAGRGGQEAAFGLSFARAGAVPLELLLERRVAIGNDARSALAAIAVTGINDVALPLSFRLNGYAQAGVVGAKSRDGFVDGALHAERTVAEIREAKLDIGLGVWGAAQPGVSRLDIGPSAALRFRLGEASLRAAAEWRERIAGQVRPGSGPALTLGVDY